MTRAGNACQPSARVPLVGKKIAIACCGLGHIARGIETWARDLAELLHSVGVNVTLFKGAGKKTTSYEVVVPCWRRNSRLTQLVSGHKLPGIWRTPLSSPYNLESYTFYKRLVPYLKNDYDLIHMQDPLVAQYLLKAKRRHRIHPAVILANGTEESHDFLAQFDFLQELDSFGLQDLAKEGLQKPGWFNVPNFVDSTKFHPGNRLDARKKLGLPEGAIIILGVGAIQRQVKRTDWLIQEFARFKRIYQGPAVLVIAGASTRESAELKRLAFEKIGSDCRIFEDLDRETMPSIYQAADIYANLSVEGIFGLSTAEAAATGLPCVMHDWKRAMWVAGPRATIVDMKGEGMLAAGLAKLASSEDTRREISMVTRKWILNNLSRDVVLARYIQMYEAILK